MKHTLVLSPRRWRLLREKITEDYGQATVLISWRLRNQLGFSVREHTDYQSGANDGWITENTIRLDFYDEQLQTLFLLRYGEFVNTEEVA